MAGQASTTSAMRSRPRPRYRAARAFYLTLALCAFFVVYVSLSSGPDGAFQGQHVLRRRTDEGEVSGEEQCRLVHHAKDQCAFVRSKCPADEAGYTTYLNLYFCSLAHAKPVALTILALWLGLLFSTIGIAASDFFCINLSTIATLLGMSESMAGVTFLAFGNGSPDVFSTFAAMNTNSGSLAVGELFGAAGFITAVVAGSMALIRPFRVAKKSFVRDVAFFTVAAGFSIVFLWDGKLRLWECICMVAYYLFYVIFVVAWHWMGDRRRKQRAREATMRGQFATPQNEQDADAEAYRDDPDEPDVRASLSRGGSAFTEEDWSALERAHENYVANNPDDDEAERERWMGGLSRNMRLTGQARNRSQTLVPVRPSFVGALEFQTVLKALEKARNLQPYPLHPHRAYSDSPNNPRQTTADDSAITYGSSSLPPAMDSSAAPRSAPGERLIDASSGFGTRLRAVSESVTQPRGDVFKSAGFAQTKKQPQNDLIDLSEGDTEAAPPTNPISNSLALSGTFGTNYTNSPTIRISPSQSSTLDRIVSGPPNRVRSPDHLAPPGSVVSKFRDTELQDEAVKDGRMTSPVERSSRTHQSPEVPKIVIPRLETSPSRAWSPSGFSHGPGATSPGHSRSPSLLLPSPIIDPSDYIMSATEHEEERTNHTIIPPRYWPYKVLPPPGVLMTTLFPTICDWHRKTLWAKFLAIVAAPSVFLLTITLPVVETPKDDVDDIPSKTPGAETATAAKASAATRPEQGQSSSQSRNNQIDQLNHQDREQHDQPNGLAMNGNSANVSEQHYHDGDDAQNYGSLQDDLMKIPTTGSTGTYDEQQDPNAWSRWLLIIQLFLAPLFITFAIYIQAPSDLSNKWIIRAVLICLLVSVVLLIPILLTTTPTHRPPIYRYILSLIGFVVSIAWISTIASQVVGALKALAVILNISHAIMGLTIFAVGNSLGDLVADITVARLGFPVMALSACIGGPMLNILLGIGLSGSWMSISGARERVHKHPGKDLKFKSYHIDVSNTLLISGFTLLLTLVGLLICVPLNKWMFGKRIGWALISIWVLSTACNVVLEVTGWADTKTLRH